MLHTGDIIDELQPGDELIIRGDLIHRDRYGPASVDVAPEMRDMGGQVVTVDRIDRSRDVLKICEDNGEFTWVAEMFKCRASKNYRDEIKHEPPTRRFDFKTTSNGYSVSLGG